MREDAPAGLSESRLERAIGVINLPRTERHNHYFRCRLTAQFDGAIQFDETEALRPLDTTSEWERGEAETYPFGCNPQKSRPGVAATALFTPRWAARQ